MLSVSKNGEKKREYVYNKINNLMSSTVDGVTTTYAYNGDRLRESKTTNGVTTRHIYDGTDVVADVTGDTTTNFVRGIGLIYSEDMTTGDKRKYALNAHGDVAKRINADGTAEKFNYRAYGIGIVGTPDPFGYCGEYTDTETGLIYLRNRYYDPELGRFINVDPVFSGANWYAYCEGNPVRYVDPDGLDVYYFVNAQFRKEAYKDQKVLEKLCNEPVHVLITDSRSSFIDEWNKMGNWDGENVDVSLVVINMHANPDALAPYPDGKTGSIKASDMQDGTLIPKYIDDILILGCNSGHFDHRYSSLVNKFLVYNIVNSVIASDGTVQNRSIFGNYNSVGNSEFVDNLWSGEKYRDNLGFIKYMKNDKGELVWDVLGKKISAKKIFEKLSIKEK